MKFTDLPMMERRSFIVGLAASVVAAGAALPVGFPSGEPNAPGFAVGDSGFAKALWPGLQEMWEREYQSYPHFFPVA